LSEEDGGGFVASIPDLPGCSGDGATQAEAIVDLESSFAAWVDAAKALRRSIPEPNSQAKPVPALVRFPKTLHADLTRSAEAEGISFNQFVVMTLAACVAARVSVALAGVVNRRWSDHTTVLTGTAQQSVGAAGYALHDARRISARSIASGYLTALSTQPH